MTVITTPTLGIDFTAESSSQVFPLGMKVYGADGTEWTYVTFSAAVGTASMAVGIDENFSAAPLTKAMVDDGWHIGFAQSAFTSAYYGWVATKGSNINCYLGANCAADVALYSTATAGLVDDDSTSQTKIEGIVSVTTIGGANAAGEIIATYPRSTTF